MEYIDDLGASMPFDVFYKKIADGADTRTSQVNISEYVDFFTEFLEQGKDIVHVCLSSGISGTINSARNAASILRERYPERKIFIIDSLGASSGYGLLMDTAATKRDEGLTVDELCRMDRREQAQTAPLVLPPTLQATCAEAGYQDRGRVRRPAGDMPAAEHG